MLEFSPDIPRRYSRRDSDHAYEPYSAQLSHILLNIASCSIGEDAWI
jgi:hypothetical protein